MQIGEPTALITSPAKHPLATEFMLTFMGTPLSGARIKVTLSSGREIGAQLDDKGWIRVEHPIDQSVAKIRIIERSGRHG